MAQLSDLGAMTIDLLLQLSLLSHVNYINLVDAGNPFDVGPKEQKIMVSMNPEGVHGQPLGLPDYTFCVIYDSRKM